MLHCKMGNRYIREWVEYNKTIGFDNIVICDNNRDGEGNFHDVIDDYINSGYVIIEDYRNLQVIQNISYAECYAKYRGVYDWIAFF